MSDDDLWRPKEPTPEEVPGEAEEATGLDETQPITGSPTAPAESSTAIPDPASAPPTSYDDPARGPSAVPPPTNPYGQAGPSPYGAPPPPPGAPPYGAPPYGGPAYGGQQNPYGAAQPPYGGPQGGYAPPPNPYPHPQEYGTPQHPYGGPYQPGYPGQPDHPSATTAMVLGIIGLVGILFCAGVTLVLSPFAWAIGAKAVREIDAQPGRFGGRDKAQAGKWMGLIGTVLLAMALVLLAVVLIVGFSVSSSNDSPPVTPNGSAFRNG